LLTAMRKGLSPRTTVYVQPSPVSGAGVRRLVLVTVGVTAGSVVAVGAPCGVFDGIGVALAGINGVAVGVSVADGFAGPVNGNTPVALGTGLAITVAVAVPPA